MDTYFAHRVSVMFSPRGSLEILGALDDAERLHHGQCRPGQTVPYIEHQVAVASRLLDLGVTKADVVKAGLLHDVLEDCDTDGRLLEHLERVHGIPTARIVQLVTNDDVVDYVEHVRHAVMAHPDAAAVKFADFLDNAGTLAGAPLSASRQVTLAHKYLPLVSVFREAFAEHGGDLPFSPTGETLALTRLTQIETELEGVAQLDSAATS